MKLRSLLLAASAVALSATAANALELKDLGGDSGVVLSDELDLTTNVEGTYDFTITRDGGSADFVPGNTVVTIRLPTGRVLTEDLSTSMGVSLVRL